MFSQKDEIDPISGEVQYWITFVGENGYMIEFLSIPENFDTPDNIEIRDRFISSINFLELSNSTDQATGFPVSLCQTSFRYIETTRSCY